MDWKLLIPIVPALAYIGFRIFTREVSELNKEHEDYLISEGINPNNKKDVIYVPPTEEKDK
ncbi:hypothetical protein KKH39_01535 [Patescibacteria group bacterium]|nr:hypothetical protein [Patescibacteria group bacterium]